MTDARNGESDSYRPGECNIGPDEIRMRFWAGHLGLLAAAMLLAVQLAVDANSAWRLLVALPATVAALGYLQAWLRFCAHFGLWGTFNFGSEARDRRRVTDPEARRRDRIRALQIGGLSILIGVAAGLLAMTI